MDKAEIVVVSGGLLLIVFTLWFFFGAREEPIPVAAKNEALYQCPMHPWISSTDAMANCTICGMKLVRRGGAS